MDLLKRDLAPILPEAWALIDQEATRVLRLDLAGRKLVDFKGPFGWGFAAVNVGRVAALAEPAAEGVSAAVRVVLPLVELRIPFVLDIADLDQAARGGMPDLTPVTRAAERIARAEDAAIFHGYEKGHILGLVPSSPHAPVRVESAERWPHAVVQAKEVLRASGVSGPYALALGPRAFDEVSSASEDGYPILKRIQRVIEGPLVWAPALRGSVLMSTRGGDFELTVGQDMSIGYAYHDRHQVELFVTESFTLRVIEPVAAIALERAG